MYPKISNKIVRGPAKFLYLLKKHGTCVKRHSHCSSRLKASRRSSNIQPHSAIHTKLRSDIRPQGTNKVTLTILFLISLLYFNCLLVIIMNTKSIKMIGVITDNVSWIRPNRSLANYIKMNQDTFLVYPRKPDICSSDNDQEVKIFYFVTSAPRNREQRRTIRRTWGMRTNPKPIFVLGRTQNNVVMNFAINEGKLYGDLIIEDFIDSYANLTIKSGFILKHFQKVCPKSLFVMKTDDDMFINTPLVTNLIDNELINYTNRKFIYGKLSGNFPPHRDHESKWYLPHWMYSGSMLPYYITGTSYILPGSQVLPILLKSFDVPMITLEDVYFTGLVANNSMGFELINDNRFREDKPLYNEFCLYRNLITAHRLTWQQLLKIWNDMESNEDKEYCNRITNKIINAFFGLV